jgi:mannitol-specific phosphotransferase system IIBC component
MAMIEKGVDASFFETQKGEKKSYGTMIFKLGMFIVGVGLGVVAAYLLSTSGNMHEGAAYPSMILIFGGIALIVVYLIEQKRLKAEDK